MGKFETINNYLNLLDLKNYGDDIDAGRMPPEDRREDWDGYGDEDEGKDGGDICWG